MGIFRLSEILEIEYQKNRIFLFFPIHFPGILKIGIIRNLQKKVDHGVIQFNFSPFSKNYWNGTQL